MGETRDLVIRNATIAGVSGVKDIGARDGRIGEVSDRSELRDDEEVQAMGVIKNGRVVARNGELLARPAG